MPIAITDEQQSLRQSITRWAARGDPRRAVRSQQPAGRGVGPKGSGEGHWRDLADLGLYGIAVPEEAGGAGGSAVDLAAALEACAEVLAGGPLLPTTLAGLILSGTLAGDDFLPKLAAGHATVAVRLPPDGTPGAMLDGAAGGGATGGGAGPVLCAGETTHLLVPVGGVSWCLVEADDPSVNLTELEPVDFSRSLADVRLAVPRERCFAGPQPQRARDLAATLYAAEAAGVAAWCLRTATEYAKLRHQFGRPIGSFQAVKHLCAGMLCRLERASAVAWDAARAVPGPEHPLAAAVAASIALDAAVDNAKDCVQVLGGIGFTWEHDAHLYLRRALALRQLLGGTARWRHRVAELALGGARRDLSLDPGPATPEPVSGGPGAPTVREAVAEIAGLPEAQRRGALADSGYLAPHWPAPYGLGATPAEQLAIDAELSRAGIDRPDLGIGGWAAPTILRYGTDAQRERFVAATLRGEITWCQLFSEPEAGSDLASLRTSAVRSDGGWRLTGQKVWTSLAREADWAICLARTDPDAPKHNGISYFLVAMDSPGIEVRPLREITGDAVFNEVFLDAVYVPDECLVGSPGDGWRLARTTLANERVAMGGGSALGEIVEELLRLAPGPSERVGGLVADGVALSLLELRETVLRLRGDDPGAASSVRKLVGVAHRQEVAEAALDLLAEPGAAAGPQAHQFLLTRCLSIAGGTTQILLTVAAERLLGLPRAP